MSARLTDKQKKKIIADYTENGNYRATAKMNNVSATTVKNVVVKDVESVQKCAQKKEQNTTDMLAYMDSRKEQAQEVVDEYLKALADPSKIQSAKLSEIATALGIVIDKFTKNASNTPDSAMESIKNMQTMAEIIKKPLPNRNIEDYE